MSLSSIRCQRTTTASIHSQRTAAPSIRCKEAPPPSIHCCGAPLPRILAKGGRLRREELAAAPSYVRPLLWRSAATEGRASALRRGEGRRGMSSRRRGGIEPPHAMAAPHIVGRGGASLRHGRPTVLRREGVPLDGREGEPPAGQGGEGCRRMGGGGGAGGKMGRGWLGA